MVTFQMLVVFKSAPILKRTLKVKHAMLQLYVLKLLKMQVGGQTGPESAESVCPMLKPFVADQIPRETVAQVEHEDDVGHLRQGPAPPQRRLGLRQR